MKKTAIILIAIIISVNIPPIKSIFEVFLGRVQYYTTKTHGFSDSDYAFQGRTFDEVLNSFEEYKQGCHLPEVVLYRTFAMNPLKIWLWGEYLFHPRYRLPYLEMPPGYEFRTLKRSCYES